VQLADARLVLNQLERERLRLGLRTVERRERRDVHLALAQRAHARELPDGALLDDGKRAELLGERARLRAVRVAKERADELQLLLKPNRADVARRSPLGRHRSFRAASPQHGDASLRKHRLGRLEAADLDLVLVFASRLRDVRYGAEHRGTCSAANPPTADTMARASVSVCL